MFLNGVAGIDEQGWNVFLSWFNEQTNRQMTAAAALLEQASANAVALQAVAPQLPGQVESKLRSA